MPTNLYARVLTISKKFIWLYKNNRPLVLGICLLYARVLTGTGVQRLTVILAKVGLGIG